MKTCPKAVLLSGLIAAALPGAALAQTTTITPTPVKLCTLPKPAPPATPSGPSEVRTAAPALSAKVLDDLNSFYNAGKWIQLRALAQKLIGDAAVGDPLNCRPLWKAGNYVALSWVGPDPLGDKRVASVLLSADDSEPFPTWLPGLGGDGLDKAHLSNHELFDVFVSDVPGATLKSVYESKQNADTRSDDAIKAVTQAVTPILTGAGVLAGGFAAPLFLPDGGAAGAAGTMQIMSTSRESRAAQPPPPPVTLSIGAVSLPHKTAELKIKRKAEIPLKRDDLATSFDKLETLVVMTDAAGDDCAIALVHAAVVDLKQKVDACPDDIAACRVELSKAMEAAWSKKTCAGDGLADAKKHLRTSISSLSAPSFTGESTLRNEPKTHVSFGTVTGYISSASFSGDRVKVGNDGNLAADPLPHLLTGFVANVSLLGGYDAKRVTMAKAEKLRAFGGLSVLPGVGVIGGVTWFPIRGFGLSVGAGALAIPTGTIGEKADSRKPFATTVAKTAFWGLSFSVK